MTARDALLVAAAVMLLVVAAIIGFKLGKGRKQTNAVEEVAAPEPGIPIDGPTQMVRLYFPGPQGRLYIEERHLPLEEEPIRQITALVAALLEGPESTELYPALPAEITPGWLHLSPAAVLYVDLVVSGEQEYPAWGSRQETLALYSLVNTVMANTPEVRAVTVLRNGQQRPTFAGHLDTSRPLLANARLVANP